MYVNWPAPRADGAVGEEMALTFDKGREHRLLVIAPLFDEANKFRRQATEIMRNIDAQGIDCVLPDLPGGNESAAPLDRQSFTEWRAAIKAAAEHFRATHLFAVRASCSLLPSEMPGLLYAPQAPARQLRAMVRARTIALREAGAAETSDEIAAKGRSEGVTLAGWSISPTLYADLEKEIQIESDQHTDLPHENIGGSPFWLWAEPGYDADQAKALSAAITQWIAPA